MSLNSFKVACFLISSLAPPRELMFSNATFTIIKGKCKTVYSFYYDKFFGEKKSVSANIFIGETDFKKKKTLTGESLTKK